MRSELHGAKTILVLRSCKDDSLDKALELLARCFPSSQLTLVLQRKAHKTWAEDPRLAKLISCGAASEYSFEINPIFLVRMRRYRFELVVIPVDRDSGNFARGRLIAAVSGAPRLALLDVEAERLVRVSFKIIPTLAFLVRSGVVTLKARAIGCLSSLFHRLIARPCRILFCRMTLIWWKISSRGTPPFPTIVKRTGGLIGRILIVSGQPGASRRYRCFYKKEQLLARHIPCSIRDLDDYEHTPQLMHLDAAKHDLFILHRVPFRDWLVQLLEDIRRMEKVVIADMDDLIFLPEKAHYVPWPIDSLKQLLADYARTLAQLKHVLVSTDYLAKAVEAMGKHPWVVRNCLSEEQLGAAETIKARRHDERLVMGYLSGSATHDWDFLEVSDVLVEIMRKYAEVSLRIVGPLQLPARFWDFEGRIKLTPLLHWRKLPKIQAGFDVNLAPLEADNPFCQAKSELKYFEAGVVGVPTVASRTEAFEYAITHGVNGLLCSDAKDWLENLELLITDEGQRRKLGENARADVLEKYSPKAGAEQLVRTLQAIMAMEGSNH